MPAKSRSTASHVATRSRSAVVSERAPGVVRVRLIASLPVENPLRDLRNRLARRLTSPKPSASQTQQARSAPLATKTRAADRSLQTSRISPKTRPPLECEPSATRAAPKSLQRVLNRHSFRPCSNWHEGHLTWSAAPGDGPDACACCTRPRTSVALPDAKSLRKRIYTTNGCSFAALPVMSPKSPFWSPDEAQLLLQPESNERVSR